MTAFNTIHLFGFGTAQIIGIDVNKQVSSAGLTKLAAFIDYIKTFKPADVVAADYHVVHIFENMDVRYLGKTNNKDDKTAFSVKWADVGKSILGELVDEIATK